ncbi:MAG: hypothetical protein IPN17_00595 [Deltaproteobacteria bacterium]|nr:hypothetical protein [Deltaproteobacteria bacterium]
MRPPRLRGAALLGLQRLRPGRGQHPHPATLPPPSVLLLTSAQHVEQGDDFGCAVRTDGTVTCWGRGDYGSLGDGTLTSRNSANRAIFGLP